MLAYAPILAICGTVSVFNGLAAIGDLLIAPAILLQVPSSAVIYDHGWEMYWKVIEGKE